MDIWLNCLLMTIGFIGAFHLPYGDKTPYWLKFLVACCFALPTLFLGVTFWQVIIPIAFIGMFWASNNKYLQAMFPWKVVEFLTGTLIGVAVAIFLKKTEWLMIGVMGAGGLGFAIGGTGFKWVRRYVLPIILGILAFIGMTMI